MEVSYEKLKNGANVDADKKSRIFFHSGNLSYIEVPLVTESQQPLHLAAGALPGLMKTKSSHC